MALRNLDRELRLSIPVWDLPTRLFHWLLLVLLVTSYVTIKLNNTELHLLSGYAVLTLLLFRVLWGLVGSRTARFASFVKNPLEALRHLAGFLRRGPDTQVGHNAAGGWMVLAMLAVIAVQVGTGLCSNDDGATEGPLARFTGKALSDRLSGLHALNFNLLLGLAGLHVAVVLLYRFVKRHDLIAPMVTGRKRLPAATPAPSMASPFLALLLLAVCAVAVWLLATRL